MLNIYCKSLFVESFRFPTKEMRDHLRNKFLELLSQAKGYKLQDEDYKNIAELRTKIKLGKENIDTLLAKSENLKLLDNYIYLKNISVDLLSYVYVILCKK